MYRIASEITRSRKSLLLSPGLALFLYGVSSIPEAGTVWDTKVLVTAAIGLALVTLFVLRSLARATLTAGDVRAIRTR